MSGHCHNCNATVIFSGACPECGAFNLVRRGVPVEGIQNLFVVSRGVDIDFVVQEPGYEQEVIFTLAKANIDLLIKVLELHQPRQVLDVRSDGNESWTE